MVKIIFTLVLIPSTVPIIASAYNNHQRISNPTRPANTIKTISKNSSAASTATNSGTTAVSSGNQTTSTAQPASNSSQLPASWTKLAFFVDPLNEAATYAQNNPSLVDVSLIAREGNMAVARWFGDWDLDVRASISAYVNRASQANALPVVVLYNIPNRDCGLYSAGGANSSTVYIKWLQDAVAGIAGRNALVILEPDALADTDCLSVADKQSRYDILSQAVHLLKGSANTWVYLDSGNPAWQTATTMVDRLKQSGIQEADGFSLNVSNYVSTSSNQAYGDQVSSLLGGKHYVIDTSRNGNSNQSPADWCNSSTAALGSSPSVNTGDALNDAFLWIKRPWESDGACKGAPEAGAEYWSFAIQLAKNAGW